MISIRGGNGLGDALYVQGVVRYFVRTEDKVEVCTSWRDVFRPLDGRVVFSPFRRRPVNRVAHYASRRHLIGTQFQDCCISAGIPRDTEFKLDWEPQNVNLILRLRDITEKPIVVVQMPRPPFGRVDGFGMEFLPDFNIIQKAINEIKDKVFLVMVGIGEPIVKYTGIDLDLSNKTSVSGLIDVAYVASGFLGQCSFIIPLAECLSKPVHVIWSRKHTKSYQAVVRQMTPQKILHGVRSSFSYDDQEVTEAMDAFCKQVRVPALV
jgi:hypothetical protein